MPRTVIVFLLTALAVQAQSPSLTGDWVNVFSRYDAKEYGRIKLVQNGKDLTSSGGSFDAKGTIHDGQVELEGKDGDGDHLKASGILEGGEIKGKARSNDQEWEWRAYRAMPSASSPKTHQFEPVEFHRFFSGAISPVLHVNPGDTIKTWTVDAGGFDASGKSRSNGGNPETGPFYIEGALPGDVISIKLNRVRLNRDSAISSPGVVASALNPYYYAGQEKVKNFKADWTLDREAGTARLKEPTEKLKDFRIPLRPMMGCIGVAPPGNSVYRSGFLGPFGGNMDYNEMREGVTLYLPVFTPGALLFIGDGHAAQGDGELTGNALETSMDVEFTVGLIPGGSKSQRGPRVESDEYLMALGIGSSLTDGLQNATTEMSRWLANDYGLNSAEVSAVLGTSMRYDIAEVVDPYVNVVAKVRKAALSTLKRVTP